jgi:cyclopropane fatty-acyl-phospholipid synthase-like methyltransferase
MKDYLEINKNAYNALAQEFYNKDNIRNPGSKTISDYFTGHLKKRFHYPIILELGPGTGHIAKFLSNSGCEVDAIEFSEKMAEICKKNSPNANVIFGDFLDYNFGNKKYSGILAVAFIHLFSSEDVKLVMKKINNLLDKKGLAFISTTLNDKVEEGYFVKENFCQKVERFRKKYTPSEIEKLIYNTNFNILDFNINEDSEIQDKKWMNYLIEKKKNITKHL